MAPPAPLTDPTCCPLCGCVNQCAMEVEKATGLPQPPCWCTTAAFPPALLDRVAPEALNLACICAACATRHAADTPAEAVSGLPIATQ